MTGVINTLAPRAAVDGGEIIIDCAGYDTTDYLACRVWFDKQRGRLISAAPDRVIVAAPETGTTTHARELRLESATTGGSSTFALGTLLADNLHPVANPAVEPDTGDIFVTQSGTRGQKVPVSIYKITPDGAVDPWNSDIVNPTGMAFDSGGMLYVTSRHEGVLHRFTPFGEAREIANDLGTATGIALDRRGNIYVGDRNGTIYRVNEIGESRPFVMLDPSVSAYHLAFGPDGDLYVSGPTISVLDAITRIDPMGKTSTFYAGLGRPQGMAFDTDGNLYVAASLRGHRGIVRIRPDGERAEVVVSGAALVGLAFDPRGDMIIASNERVFRVPMGIKGYSVFGS
ncbi:MAG: SMP-30/gluconolactonase/LRE family protein [Blastocatellia bacterium]